MQSNIQAQSALISVFNKDGLAPIVKKLHALDNTLQQAHGGIISNTFH